jgi:hypothetical protein
VVFRTLRRLLLTTLSAAALAAGWLLWGGARPAGEAATLNTAPCQGGEDLRGAALAETLNRAVLGLKGKFFTESGRVDYRAMKGSPEWAVYEGLAGCLRAFDPATLAGRAERLAFWINLYNALVVHGVLAADVPQSVTKVPSFFDTTAYEIGGLRFSLEDIEHGVLRGNRPKHLRPWAPLPKSDPRLKYALESLDPRIHFALVCGARSCPPVGAYTADRIDEQLDLAARSFVNQAVEAAPGGKELRVSSILQWYEADFGGRDGVLNFLRRTLSPGPALRLLEAGAEPKISYVDYDWSLNDAT